MLEEGFVYFSIQWRGRHGSAASGVAMRRALPLFVLLAGCPEPVATTDGAMSSPGGGAGSVATAPVPAGGGGAPATDGGAGGAPAVDGGGAGMGTFGSASPDADLEPRYAQDDIDDAWVVSGTTACSSCSGAILVRVLPPPPDQGGADEEIHLITRKSYDEPGEFEIKIPKRYSTVVLQVVDDADEDGKPSMSEAMGIPTSGPTKVAGNVSDVELIVGVFPEAPAIDGVGQTLEAPGTTGAAPMGDGSGPPAGGAEGAVPGDGALPAGGPEGPPPGGAGGPDGPVPGGADGAAPTGAPAEGGAPVPEPPADGG